MGSAWEVSGHHKMSKNCGEENSGHKPAGVAVMLSLNTRLYSAAFSIHPNKMLKK